MVNLMIMRLLFKVKLSLNLEIKGQKTLVIGCGLGDDAEALAPKRV